MTHSVISIILLIAIAIISAVDVNADPTEKQCDGGNRMTFEDWMDWRKVTPMPVRSEGHNNNWVGIYIDELAEDTYLSASAPYPECARIVKPIYNDADGKSVRKLTIMVKMAPGYDPKNGDWWYASSDATGTKIGEHGRLNGCIPCHKQATETDYLFSKEVLDAVKE